mmetsp:Transcript_42764/g.100247  ORF Transcript_42764/g.100247 Transcript_42764/m.100247 type:complete len:538 (-) Transcript_42764:128-1741(-)|eukprot:CAMPEP_0178380066 /NCGR_PEP_ID=MMETSP0689_2-20121128/5268_1 /TAXON_ID=160604 /ORGANISM="Amphidinium massartii, Strain CS-259" /LENGTH=537 /DNA_ID=CAMNT_0020000191 /DNA_START=46 /DNA_END=1659 /DNA_ORIENTATION=+
MRVQHGSWRASASVPTFALALAVAVCHSAGSSIVAEVDEAGVSTLSGAWSRHHYADRLTHSSDDHHHHHYHHPHHVVPRVHGRPQHRTARILRHELDQEELPRQQQQQQMETVEADGHEDLWDVPHSKEDQEDERESSEAKVWELPAEVDAVEVSEDASDDLRLQQKAGVKMDTAESHKVAGKDGVHSDLFTTVATASGIEARYPEPFTVALPTANACESGDATVPESACIRAVQSVLVNVSQASMSFVVGDGTGRPSTTWGFVPPGCSLHMGRDNSSVTIYFNHGQGANSGDYRLVCLKGDFVGAGHCKEGMLRGWDGLGLDSVQACIQVCRGEADCGWVAYCPPTNPACRHSSRSAAGTCTRYRRDALCTPLQKVSQHDLAFDTYLVPQRSYLTFGGCDSNGDKVVTREEFLRQELQDAVSQARGRVIFEELDHDMDGVLQREEFFSQGVKELGTRVGDVDALVNVFFYLDTNGDKQLTYQEVVNGIGSSSHQIREAQSFFVAADANGNGVLTRDEFIHGSQNRQNKILYTWQGH